MKKIDGVYQAKDLTEEIWSLYKGETETTHSCGFKSIDKNFKILKPSFNLITGCPNSGKSSLTFEIALRTSRNLGFKYMIFSPESSLAVNLKRLIEKFVKKPFDIIFKKRANETEVLKAIEWIHEHFYFLDLKGDLPSIDWILDKAKKIHEQVKLDGLIIDPYNEISPDRQIREDEHISVLISKIKRFNRDTDTFTFMVVHPTKQIRDFEGKFKMTSLMDCSGSANWNNKCDAGIIVTRDYERHQTEVRIAKIREHAVQGRIGCCYVRWNDSTKCFEDLNIM